MSADDPIEHAAQAVADGTSVDWQALEDQQADSVAREIAANLKIVQVIAAAHQADVPFSATVDSDAPTADIVAGEASVEGGARWGRYTLRREVGAGSFGCVYRAWDPWLERDVAIKILYADAATESLKRRLLAEARALAKVKHANVVTVLGVEEHGDSFGLCMDFVEGETLEDILKARGTFNPREANLVAQDVCRALVAVHHEAKLVHRDVKARNVMRERAGRILLMDFGAGLELAELEAASRRGSVAGTPLYMAPEVLAGGPASESSDVYSVGVLMYHLVTGKYPVEGRTLGDIKAAHMLGKRTPIGDRRADLPASFIRVVDRALAPDATLRFKTAGELLGALVEADVAAEYARITLGRRALRSVVLLAALVAFIEVCGFLNDFTFNHLLGRVDFADDGVIDWFLWGLKSLLFPILFTLFIATCVSALWAIFRLLLRITESAQAFEHWASATIKRRRLDDPGNLASLAVLITVVCFGAAYWHFISLVNVLTEFVPDLTSAPDVQLAMLSPASLHSLDVPYRGAFVVVTLVSVVAWYLVFRSASKRHERVNRTLLLAGGAISLLTLVMLDFPYRMLTVENQRFETVRWNDARCYVLGERGTDILLFCPQLTPRKRLLHEGSAGIERLGISESLFTEFERK